MTSLQDDATESLSSQEIVDQDNGSGSKSSSKSFFFLLEKRQQDETHVFSSWHIFGGFRWRLFIFPRGNHTNTHLSIYLECGGPTCRDDSSCETSFMSKESDLLIRKECCSQNEFQCKKHNPSTWQKSILFSVTLWRLDNPFVKQFIEQQGRLCNLIPKEDKFVQHFRSTDYTFSNTGCTDWGWLEFIELDELHTSSFIDKDGHCVFSTRLTESC